ncbi:MAG: hypothetical protein JWP87_217 [Labilithrix sp.]|nr:hypothetical protein [Labilithrix sp.]
MSRRAPSEVAKRCLCIELLLQRLGLEIDEDDPVAERDAVRRAWLSRLGQLGIEESLRADERALLERSIGELTEAECDDIEKRVIAGLALLWALGRIPSAPDAPMLGDATMLIAEHGVLGDGSISGAKATVDAAKLRPDAELDAALAAYAKTKDESFLGGPEHMVASVAVQALSWLEAEAPSP